MFKGIFTPPKQSAQSKLQLYTLAEICKDIFVQQFLSADLIGGLKVSVMLKSRFLSDLDLTLLDNSKRSAIFIWV
ncbi:MAG: hypothetical protein A2142_04345 [candidate division Zixibacteria bacterium RBG_16_48_11]|nr:MAG: hypothetical protein A2142_04345 [candidate division Zixibacteria bacterium RBG_16_48_11]